MAAWLPLSFFIYLHNQLSLYIPLSRLRESTKIENTSFPDKTGILQVNVMTNRMVSTKWNYLKERSFASNYFVFFFFFSQFENLL